MKIVSREETFGKYGTVTESVPQTTQKTGVTMALRIFNQEIIMEKKSIFRNPVFTISISIFVIMVIWAFAAADSFNHVSEASFNFLTGRFGWLYIMSVAAFLVWCLYIAFSKYGRIKLGPDDSTPEYSTFSWFSMLFSAGMGIGMVFFAIAEPLQQYIYQSPASDDAAQWDAKVWAVKTSFFHWGLHPWACFCVIGLGLAYMQFRKGKPGLISSIFIPLIGEKLASSWIGKAIDILAIVATVLGKVSSLGIGTLQINAGLHYIFGMPENNAMKVAIIGSFTVIFTAAAVSGIEKGIDFIAKLNIWFVFILMALAFFVGPTLTELHILSDSTGMYLQNIVGDSLYAGLPGNTWSAKWTIFFWAWWISWGPFVGTFIARISRGRTIREFIIAVLIVPTALTLLWFAFLAPMGLEQTADIIQQAAGNSALSCFLVFGQYGVLGKIMAVITLVLVMTFFVTSADSAVIVLGIFSENGTLDPSKKTLLIWGILEGAFAIVLMIGSENALSTMETLAIVGAFPFIFVEIGAMIGLTQGLRREKLPKLDK